jgi:hypothetical protein
LKVSVFNIEISPYLQRLDTIQPVAIVASLGSGITMDDVNLERHPMMSRVGVKAIERQ